MRKESWFLGVLVLILLILIFFSPSRGWDIRGLIAGRRSGLGYNQLALENQALKAELSLFKGVGEQLPASTGNYVPALVYSRYPFNLKDELTLNAGQDEGVWESEPVVIGLGEETRERFLKSVLVGSIKKVFQNKSVVTTIFDAGWRSEVRVGEAGAEALLVGGVKPKLTLIRKEANLQEGDAVYSVDSRFPYGLVLGKISEARLASDGLLQEADLELGYDLSRVKVLLILKFNGK